MVTGHVDNNTFFTNLTTLLATHSTSHGSIYLTQKRLSATSSSPPTTSPIADIQPPPSPLPLLIRATNGKSKPHRLKGEKIKLSTIVQPEALEGFFKRYAEVMKAGTAGGLRKRDRSGRKGRKKKGGEKKV